jgi:hypothetical protein
LAAAPRDASADECRELPRLGADAGKWAGLELACLELDGLTWDVSVDPAAVLWLLAEPLLALAELDKPVSARSAAQSFAAQVAAADSASGQRVVELELARSATELARLAAQNSLAKLGCARPEELLA